MSLIAELKRRKVCKVGAPCVVGAWLASHVVWLIVQVSSTVRPMFLAAVRIWFADSRTAMTDLQLANGVALKDLREIRKATP